tara:strand:- start:14 stop:244 length:231 start_codon:yes stop_codon:yes gene_type:complete
MMRKIIKKPKSRKSLAATKVTGLVDSIKRQVVRVKKEISAVSMVITLKRMKKSLTQFAKLTGYLKREKVLTELDLS